VHIWPLKTHNNPLFAHQPKVSTWESLIYLFTNCSMYLFSNVAKPTALFFLLFLSLSWMITSCSLPNFLSKYDSFNIYHTFLCLLELISWYCMVQPCKFVYYLSQINHFCFIYYTHSNVFSHYFHTYKCVYYISCLVIANYIPLMVHPPMSKYWLRSREVCSMLHIWTGDDHSSNLLCWWIIH
jgi:hypothetical protein